jgi:Flp pilus assembly protein TadB
VTDVRPATGLQTIFAIFLGLMVATFVGVGVYTFYPSPDAAYVERTTPLHRRQQAIRNAKAPDALTDADRAEIQRIEDELAALEDERRALGQTWGRRTAIIVILLATLFMTVSVLRAVELPVISNGLLLGGVFTMIYGVGWIVVSDTTAVRFVMLTAALAVTLLVGYVRFVGAGRPRGVQQDAEITSASIDGTGLGALEARVRALEARLDRAAAALDPTGDDAAQRR